MPPWCLQATRLGGHSLPGVYAVQMAPSTSVLQHSYLQLAQQVRRDITLKRYAPGERLPSVRALAAAQGVSVATVVRCYRHLEALGMVQARHKSGMYVAEPAPVRAAPGAKDGADPSDGPGLQARARPAVPPPVEFDRLVSLEHRMTQLYALTTQQPLQWGLHLANAAPAWYPTEALARIAQRLLRSQPEMLGAYPTGSGLPALRTELAGWMATYGLDLQPDELLVTNGSTEALNVALRAVTRPGDAVVVESPVYFGLLQMLGNLGLRAIELPCTPGEGMSLEALEYALEHQSGVRAVVAMPNFQNPLGHVMPDRKQAPFAAPGRAARPGVDRGRRVWRPLAHAAPPPARESLGPPWPRDLLRQQQQEPGARVPPGLDIGRALACAHGVAQAQHLARGAVAGAGGDGRVHALWRFAAPPAPLARATGTDHAARGRGRAQALSGRHAGAQPPPGDGGCGCSCPSPWIHWPCCNARWRRAWPSPPVRCFPPAPSTPATCA